MFYGMNRDVIIWQDATKVMPGTEFNDAFETFLIRYSWEEELTDCFYGVAKLKDGKFWLIDECMVCEGCSCTIEHKIKYLSSATVTHWALLQHSKDFED